MSKRSKHTLPFIVILIFHLALLIYTFIKHKENKRELFILLLSNIGMAYLFEYFILNLFHAYTYKPRVFKNNYLDNILGGVLSQAIFVPFTAVYLTAFHIGWKGKVLFSSYFALIEKIFVKMGIYKQNWWKTRYTWCLITVYFLISDDWYKHLQKGTSIVLHLSLYFCINVCSVNLLYILAALRRFKAGFGMVSSWKEHFIVVPIYTIIFSVFTTWQIKKQGVLPKINIFIFSLLFDWFIRLYKSVNVNLKYTVDMCMIHVVMIFLAEKFKEMVYNLKTGTIEN